MSLLRVRQYHYLRFQPTCIVDKSESDHTNKANDKNTATEQTDCYVEHDGSDFLVCG